MLNTVLIVASTRAHADTQEILRVQDTVSALLKLGCAVDLLVPRVSPLLTAAIDPAAHIYTVPHLPGHHTPSERPSFRRFATSLLMFLRGFSLMSRHGYCAVHGLNDGAATARNIARTTLKRVPYIAEVHLPANGPDAAKGLFASIARRLERKALKFAGAVVLPDEYVLSALGENAPRSRVAIIPDPHAEITPEAFTIGEFITAIRHLYDYVLRPRSES